MISFEHSTLIILALYTLATLMGILGMLLRQGWLRTLALCVAFVGVLGQTMDMARGSHGIMPDGLSWGAYIQLLAWFLMLCSMVGSVKLRSTIPTLFVTPLALMLFLMSYRFSDITIHLPKNLGFSFYALHIGTLYLSLALLSLGFAASVIFIYIDNIIKNKQALPSFIKDFPALALLDKIIALSVGIGFPLFTIGIISGFTWATLTWNTTFTGDPKEVLSVFIWMFYALLFYTRIFQGRRGRRPALMLLYLFALSLFSILIVNFFVETHHSLSLQR